MLYILHIAILLDTKHTRDARNNLAKRKVRSTHKSIHKVELFQFYCFIYLGAFVINNFVKHTKDSMQCNTPNSNYFNAHSCTSSSSTNSIVLSEVKGYTIRDAFEQK